MAKLALQTTTAATLGVKQIYGQEGLNLNTYNANKVLQQVVLTIIFSKAF
jgi:hypothetical protein